MTKFPNLKNIFWIGIILAIAILILVLVRQSKQISFETITNTDFSNLYSNEIQSESVIFEHGQYRKPADIFATLIIQLPFAAGDINGDFLTDYVIIVLRGYKSSFSDCDLVLVINQNGKPFPVQRISLNTSYCDPTGLQIRQNHIILEDNSFEYTKITYEFKDGILSNVPDEK